MSGCPVDEISFHFKICDFCFSLFYRVFFSFDVEQIFSSVEQNLV